MFHWFLDATTFEMFKALNLALVYCKQNKYVETEIAFALDF